MKIDYRFNILGFTISGLSITLDFSDLTTGPAAGGLSELVDEGIGEVSRLWVDRGMKKSRLRSLFKKGS